MGAKMTQSRKKAEKALYDKFKSQEKPESMPFSPGSIFIKFGNKKVKKIPTVEEMMKKREKKKKAKKKTKESKRKRRGYRKKTVKGLAKTLKKKKKKGGRRRRRTRKRKGGDLAVGDIYRSNDTGKADGYDFDGEYIISSIGNNYIYFNNHELDLDDDYAVPKTLLDKYFEKATTNLPGGRRRRTKKKRRRKRR